MNSAVTTASASQKRLSLLAFGERLHAILLEEAWRNVDEVPRIGVISDIGQPFDLEYYLRHRIETVHRIRFTARTDALALAAMVPQHYEAARRWADYTAEEMKHDRLFLADLAKHGWHEARVLSVPPLQATLNLIDYLTSHIESDGGIAAVAYSIFVEWNSAKFSRQTLDRAEQALGADYVKGARAHINIDVKEDHCQEMFDIAYQLTGQGDAIHVLERLLRDIAALLRASFVELHELTAGAEA